MAVELFDDEVADAARVNRLENYYRSRVPAGLIWSIVVLVLGFVIWAMYFHIDEVARAHGEVIASSRVQIIQTVDGGVLSELHVKEGDHVKAGQILALIQTPDGEIERIQRGSYMGLNHGRVTRITPTQIDLIEIIPDGREGYVERPRSLVLIGPAP